MHTPIISSASKDLQELVYDFFLQQMNMYPTRSHNILDLILTNAPESIHVSCVAPNSSDLSSDHNLLLFDFKYHVKQLSRDLRTVFDYSKADWESLYKILSVQNDDIDQEWRNWSNRFLEIVSRHIPTKVIKKRTSPPWFDHEIRHLLKKKETANKRQRKVVA